MGIALVTGANSGIGRAAAIRLAADGHTVYGGMRRLESGSKLTLLADQAGVEVRHIQIDMVDNESVLAAVASITSEAGPIDILVNNAGVGPHGTVEDTNIDEAKAVFDVNVWGVVRGVQAVVGGMRDSGGGVIVNISSVTGQFAAIGQAAYSSSKWAVEGMSELMAQELAPFGIRVKIIEPGITKTAIMAKNADLPTSDHYEDVYRRMFAFYASGLANPVGPEVVADAVSEAVADTSARLRYRCAWGANELIAGRATISDEDWVALGTAATDEEYFERFERAFGLDIRFSM